MQDAGMGVIGRQGRLTSVLRPYAGRLGAVVGLLGLLAMANMALPLSVKIIIDDVFPGPDGQGGSWRLLWIVLPALAVIYVVRNTLFYVSRMLAVGIGEDVCFALRKRLFEHLQQMSVGFYQSHQVGKLSSRVMDDTFKLQLFIQDKLPKLVLNLLMLAILLVIIYAVNWKLALVSTIVLPMHFLTYKRFRGAIRQSHSQAQDHLATTYGWLVERLLGVEVVKGFAAEQRESAEFDRAIARTRRSQVRTQRFHFGQKVAADLLIGIGTVGLLGFGAAQVVGGVMTTGVFFMFFGYVMMLYPTVLEVLNGTGHFARAAGSTDGILDVLSQRPTDLGVHDDAPAPELRGEIVFEDVHFAYDRGHEVLRGLRLRIRPGEHVAIVGPSGAGKTTFCSLVPRFVTPTRGAIRVDGRDISTYSLTGLRRAVGVAFQEVFLFNSSILENLLYARPDADVQEIVELCKLTGAHDFIMQMPTGYGASPTEIGGRLSRGEKQRITLARALLKQPSVLIMDEATASLDAESARTIVQGVFDRMQGRTVIMITHDPDLAALADRTIELREGRITADSDPAPLAGESPSGTPLAEVTADAGGRLVRDAAKVLLLLCAVVIGACVSSSTTSSKSIELSEPRIGGGLVGTGLMAAPEVDDREMSRAIEELEARWLAERGASAALGGRAAPLPSFDDALQAGPGPDLTGTLDPQAIDPSRFPPDAGRVLPLGKLGRTELDEIVDAIALRLQTTLGYAPANGALAEFLPPLPRRVARGDVLARSGDDGLRLIRLGYRRYLSQPPQLWAYGVIVRPEDIVQNPDLDAVEPALEEIVASVGTMREELSLVDLEAQIIQLSFIDAQSAISALRGLGVTVQTSTDEMPPATTFETLPIVTAMPAPAGEDMGLIGGNESAALSRDTRGLSIIPSIASSMNAETVSGPVSQLLVLFHPANPEQFSRVEQLLTEIIDVPARQVFIEGMVLEIGEDGLDELGIEWAFQDGSAQLTLGNAIPGVAEETLDFFNQDSADLAADWSLRIRALVSDGKAEILSRPSVLTLDNRQATIRVGEDIPVVRSQEGTAADSNKIAFDFQYIPTGILLNVRPRIDAKNEQVSMQIDTTVSNVVPNRDLEVRDAEGTLLASAPTISSRRVQTYARVVNNTPFIIGGLVSRDRTVLRDKVPVLGDMPLVGALFRSEREQTRKREVIIVLTPYVIVEGERLARNVPRTVELFDSADNTLFRDAYRLREEEVFDLAFLTENRRLVTYRRLANDIIRQNFRLAQLYPFTDFAANRIPGEEILVQRMMYEVVKSQDLAGTIDEQRLIYFEPDEFAGYSVRFLEDVLSSLGDGVEMRSFFANHPDKALYVTFAYTRDELDADGIRAEATPEVGLIECDSREKWGELLWKMNQPDPDGVQRYTILLHDPEKDLERLRRAIALKRIVQLNGGEASLRLSTFQVGAMLELPDLREDAIHVIDADVARYFFHTEHYYPAALQKIDAAIDVLDELVRRPEYAPYIEGRRLSPRE